MEHNAISSLLPAPSPAAQKESPQGVNVNPEQDSPPGVLHPRQRGARSLELLGSFVSSSFYNNRSSLQRETNGRFIFIYTYYVCKIYHI